MHDDCDERGGGEEGRSDGHNHGGKEDDDDEDDDAREIVKDMFIARTVTLTFFLMSLTVGSSKLQVRNWPLRSLSSMKANICEIFQHVLPSLST